MGKTIIFNSKISVPFMSETVQVPFIVVQLFTNIRSTKIVIKKVFSIPTSKKIDLFK